MGIFGTLWENHYQKIYDNWRREVSPGDLVLVPGDISWALDLEQARHDLEFLGALPGQIILVRGNHDYWWQSLSKVRRALPGNVRALQNDSCTFSGVTVCGSRGWSCPGSDGFTPDDLLIYRREVQRLELSLKTAPRDRQALLVMSHYMPTADHHEKSDFIALMQDYGADLCLYGHLHSRAQQIRLPDFKWGIRFALVSADFLDFRPRLLWQG